MRQLARNLEGLLFQLSREVGPGSNWSQYKARRLGEPLVPC
jgi:hypothetical protein